MKIFFITFLAAALSVIAPRPDAPSVYDLSPSPAALPPEAPALSVDVTFMDHLEAGLIEQDVFIEKPGHGSRVYRVLPAEKEQYLDASVFTTATPVAHNPFSADAAGTYPKGKALNMTMGQWLEASGSARYVCDGGQGTVTASFQNLVPEAVYTMWHFFMAMPPTDPFTGTLDLPVGARDGSQSVFRTDARGTARFQATFAPCLQLSDEQLASGLAIAWHSDGKTYGPLPGAFGQASHVQLFAMLPQEDDVATR